jgi:hypothetical protein
MRLRGRALAVILAAAALLCCAGLLHAETGQFSPPEGVVCEDDAEDLTGQQLVVKWKPPSQRPRAGFDLVAYAVWTEESGRATKLAEVVTPPFPEEFESGLGGLRPGHRYIARVDALYAPRGAQWVEPADKPPAPEPEAKPPPAEGEEAPAAGPPTELGAAVAVVARAEGAVIDLNALAAAENATVKWDGATQTATVTLAGKLVNVKIGEKWLTVDRALFPMPRPATFEGAALEVPVAPLKETLGLPVGKPVDPEVFAAYASEAVIPVGAWYDTSKTNRLAGTLLISLVFLIALSLAQRRDMYIRPIAGLQAVDDAIGRATEMGRPILYISGLSSLGDIATIAAMLILGQLARRTAAYATDILVPANDALVMTVEREIVREAYLEAGRPDAFNQDNIYYVTDSQFGYVAAVDGIMLRERPAANFFMGYFAAEALLLAETGNYTGAVQIAGTDQDTQLPFFITTCDYTLMGEELYAAGAYLSRAPVLMAQLKGQDFCKSVMVALLFAGTIAATIALLTAFPQLAGWVEFMKTK